MMIRCPSCGVKYSIAKYIKKLIKCQDCGVLYYQEQCDCNKTILDYVKTHDKQN